MDTAAREREIEERMARQQDEHRLQNNRDQHDMRRR